MSIVDSKGSKADVKSAIERETQNESYRHLETKPRSHRRTVLRPKAKPAVSAIKSNQVIDLRQKIQLNQVQFARLLAVSVRSLATLESGRSPTEVVARRLNEVQRLARALAEVIHKDSLGTWLQTTNAAFDGLKPLEVIDRGEIDRVWSMIFFLRSGVPS